MRILLASLDGFLGCDVAVILRGAGFALDQAESHDEAAQMARHYSYDAIAFGATAAGADFVRRMRMAGSHLPAIALGRMPDGRGRARMLDAGADDVVDMPCDTAELCARLRAVVRRARGFARSALAVGPLELHMDSRTAIAAGRDLRLSPSEYRVLELLALRKGTVVSKSALMDLLYGDFDEPDVKSLNVLMHRLRKRLATEGLDGLIRTVWGTGYMAVDAPARPCLPLLPAGAMRDPAMAD